MIKVLKRMVAILEQVAEVPESMDVEDQRDSMGSLFSQK